jgi:hypothetical protein
MFGQDMKLSVKRPFDVNALPTDIVVDVAMDVARAERLPAVLLATVAESVL